MKNLKAWQKLLLVGVVLLLPFAAVTREMVSLMSRFGTEFARHEVRGLEYYSPLLALLKNLQQQRGLTSTWLRGDASFKERVDAKRRARLNPSRPRSSGRIVRSSCSWTIRR
jgi:hypothetical protein